MYIEEHTHPIPGGISIKGMTRQDLLQLYRALGVVPEIFMSDRLRQLRDTIWRFLSDNQ